MPNNTVKENPEDNSGDVKQQLDALAKKILSSSSIKEQEVLMKELWEQTPSQNIHNIDEEGLQRKVVAKALAGDKQSNRPPIRRENIGRRRSRTSAVIYLCLLLTVSIAAFFYLRNNTLPEEDARYTYTETVKENPRGIRSSFFLTDGTKVHLNAQSKLVFREDFGQKERRVYLEGEAFFEVAKDASKPFVVVSDNLVTTAVGTSFNVRDYRKDRDAATSLATGIVDVLRFKNGQPDTTSKAVRLMPSQQLTYNKFKREMEVESFNSDLTLAWMNNTIHFENTAFKNMVYVLERWYDVDIQMDIDDFKQIMNVKGTGKFTNQSLEVVLEALGYSMGFTSEFDSNRIVIKPT
ncbi:FecR family protein [Roseivirga pacifica]